MDNVAEGARTGLRKAEVADTGMVFWQREDGTDWSQSIGFAVIGNGSLNFN